MVGCRMNIIFSFREAGHKGKQVGCMVSSQTSKLINRLNLAIYSEEK